MSSTAPDTPPEIIQLAQHISDTLARVAVALEALTRTPQATEPRPKRYLYVEAADELRVEVRWLQSNIKRLPYSRKGRTVTFSDDDLARIDQMYRHEPAQTTPLPHRAGPYPHPVAGIKPLPRRGARPKI